MAGQSARPGLFLHLEGVQRAFATEAEIEHGSRIIGRAQQPGIMDAAGIDSGQLRHPAADEATVGIEAPGLRDGVEDAEIRRSVGTSRCAPLPAAASNLNNDK